MASLILKPVINYLSPPNSIFSVSISLQPVINIFDYILVLASLQLSNFRMDAPDIAKLIDNLRSQTCTEATVKQYLLDPGLARTIPFEQFMSELEQSCTKDVNNEERFKEVRQSIRAELKRLELQNKDLYMVQINDRKFQSKESIERHSLKLQRHLWFVDTYYNALKEAQEQRSSEQGQLARQERQQSQQNQEAIQDDDDKQYNQEDEQEVESQQAKKKIKPDEQNNLSQYQQEVQHQINQDNEADQAQITQNQQQARKFPEFLLNYGFCLQRYLSFNVTQSFTDELRQVLDLIRSQTSRVTSFIFKKFKTVVHNYQLFRLLKSIQHKTKKKFEQKINEYIEHLRNAEEKINVTSYGEDYYVYEIWLKIHKKLMKLFKDTRIPSKEIQNELPACFQKIELYFSPFIKENLDQEFGETFRDYIVVNMNHINLGLEIQNFRMGPLKPYLYIVLLHEFTHKLIRRFKFFDLDNLYDSINDPESGKIFESLWRLIKPCYKQIIEPTFNQLKIQSYNIDLYSRNIYKAKQAIKLWKITTYQDQNLEQQLKLQYQTLLEIKDILKFLQVYLNFEEIWVESDNVEIFKQLGDYYSSTSPKKSSKKDYMFVAALFVAILQLKKGKSYAKKMLALMKKIIQSQLFSFSGQGQKIFKQVMQVAKPFYDQLEKLKLTYKFCQFFLQSDPFTNFQKRMQSIIKKISEVKIVAGIIKKFSLSTVYPIQAAKIFKPKTLHDILIIMKIFQSWTQAARKLKFSEILLICCQIPLEYINKEISEGYDNGYLFQQITFPSLSLDESYVYADDYVTMLSIDQTSSSRIGMKPNDQYRQRLAVRTQKRGRVSQLGVRFRPVLRRLKRSNSADMYAL